MNWKQLKDFCNSLPESELEKNVMLWGEDEAVTDISAEQLKEDNYVNNEFPEDGCFDKTEAESQIKMNPEDFPNSLEHFKKVYDKGNPMLHKNFNK